MPKFCLYMPPLSSIGSYKEMVDFASAHNIKYLETLNILDLSSPNLEVAKSLKAYADEKGISFPCVSVGLNLVDEDNAGAIETLKRYADVAKILGSPYLHHTIALNFSDPNFTQEIQEQRFQLGAECALEVCDYANSLGVRTLIEDQGFVFNGVENCLRLHRLSQGKIGFVADVGNIYFYDEKPEDFILAANDQVCHVHIKDYHYTPGHQSGTPGYRTWQGDTLQDAEIGTGCIDFAKVFSAFDQIDYQGMYALEFGAVKDLNEVERVIQLMLRS